MLDSPKRSFFDSRRLFVALFVMCANLVSGPALAAEVTGKIEVAARSASKEKPPSGAYLRPIPNGFLPVRRAGRGGASEIALALVGNEASRKNGCVYELRNGGVNQSAWVAQAGSKIVIKNRDGIPYELFAEGLAEFKALQTAPGSKRSLSIKKPGAWLVRDKNFRHIKGALHAIKGLQRCARPSESGSFKISGVESGNYSLMAFHGTKMLKSITVRVGKGKTKLPPIRVSLPAPVEGNDAKGSAKP